MLVVTGIPVWYAHGLYNCMVSFTNGKLVFVYAKGVLANDDIYRESRWFVPWQRDNEIVDFDVAFYGFEQVYIPIFIIFIDYFSENGPIWTGIHLLK
jgi:predicted amidohydrolase